MLLSGTTVYEAHTLSGGQLSEEVTRGMRTQSHAGLRVAGTDTIVICDIEGSGVVRQIFLALSATVQDLVEDLR